MAKDLKYLPKWRKCAKSSHPIIYSFCGGGARDWIFINRFGWLLLHASVGRLDCNLHILRHLQGTPHWYYFMLIKVGKLSISKLLWLLVTSCDVMSGQPHDCPTPLLCLHLLLCEDQSVLSLLQNVNKTPRFQLILHLHSPIDYYCQQRQVGRANEQSTSLRCLCIHQKAWLWNKLPLQVYLERKTHIQLGSGYASVGRAVASYTRGPLFKCSSQLSVEKAKQVKLLLILAWTKQLNPHILNRRSAEQWYFPFS